MGLFGCSTQGYPEGVVDGSEERWKLSFTGQDHIQTLEKRWGVGMAGRCTLWRSRSGPSRLEAGENMAISASVPLSLCRGQGTREGADFQENGMSMASRQQMAPPWLGGLTGWPSLALGRAAYGSSSRPGWGCWAPTRLPATSGLTVSLVLTYPCLSHDPTCNPNPKPEKGRA